MHIISVRGAAAGDAVCAAAALGRQAVIFAAGDGDPILGDGKYGNNAANRELKLKYQALCAYSLHFPALPDGSCAALSGKTLYASRPWYYAQVLDGTLK